MKLRTENILIGTALILGLVAVVGLFIFLISKWPLYTGLAYAGLILLYIAQDFGRRRRLAATLKGSSEIRDGEAGDFIGIYAPHWEVPHITVPARRYRLMFPLFEDWLPSFPNDGSLPDYSDSPKKYFIRFRGRPSERGHFGHMGSADRTVEITEIHELRPA